MVLSLQATNWPNDLVSNAPWCGGKTKIRAVGQTLMALMAAGLPPLRDVNSAVSNPT